MRVGRRQEECVAQHTHIELPSSEGASDHGPAELFARRDTSVKHAPLGEVVLGRCEPPWLLAAWQSREDEESSQGNRETYDAVNDEQPAPASHSANTRHILARLAGNNR